MARSLLSSRRAGKKVAVVVRRTFSDSGNQWIVLSYALARSRGDWRDQTPEDFVFSWKASKYITPPAAPARTVRLWNTATGEETAKLEGHELDVRSVTFSPDGATVASASWDRTVRLWNVKTGSPLHTLVGHTGDIWSAAFAPDGRTLVTGGADRTIRFWDVASGKQVRTIEGEPGFVMSLAYAPDGKSIVTGSWDKTAALWDAATGKRLRKFTGHTGNVRPGRRRQHCNNDHQSILRPQAGCVPQVDEDRARRT